MNKIINNVSKVRREAGRDFRIFRQLYFPHFHKLPDAPFHGNLSARLNAMSINRGAKLAVAGPRGSAKTSISTTEYPLYCICYNLEPYITLFSNTADQAMAYLMDIKLELMENRLLIEDFPNVSELGKKPKPPRWREDEILTRNGIKVTALSYNQQPRGRKNRNERPTLVICDDVEPSNDFDSLKGADKMYRWLTRAVLKMGTHKTNYMVLGTVHNYHSLLARLLDNNLSPEWQKIYQKAVISWSDEVEKWAQWARIFHFQEMFNNEAGPVAAEKFFNAHRDAMLKGTEVYWPEQHDYYSLMVIRERDGYASFDSEMQNEPLNPDECLLDHQEMIFFDDRQQQDELLRSLGTQRTVIGGCDPSLGKSNIRGDFSAIVTLVKDEVSGTMYVLNADIERRKPDKIIADILNHNRTYNYDRFIFEANQFQAILANELERKSLVENNRLMLEPITNTGDKHSRIMSLQSLIKTGRLQFSRRDKALLEQIRTFPKGHDDGLDALEMCVRAALDGGYYGPIIAKAI